MEAKEKITRGSGNVFTDLGFSNAELMQAKADLAIQIDQAITARDLTQTQAATLLGIAQPQVSNIQNGHLSGFTIDRLTRFLTRLDLDVTIRVQKKTRRSRNAAAGGRLRVEAA